MLLALGATAIVIIALMWEVSMPRIEEELDDAARYAGASAFPRFTA